MKRKKEHMKRAIVQKIRAALLARFGCGFDRLLAERKRVLFSDLEGTIVEIGPGTGNNLRYYAQGIEWIGIEPNRFMHGHLRTAMEKTGIQGRISEACAESIPVETGSADVVVSTLVLCSVSDPVRALAEIRRVLRPEGQFIFIEHVAARRGSWLRRLQRAIRPLWHITGDGCCPDRDLAALIAKAGFEISTFEDFMLRGASFVTPRHITGRAVVGAPAKGDIQPGVEAPIAVREARGVA